MYGIASIQMKHFYEGARGQEALEALLRGRQRARGTRSILQGRQGHIYINIHIRKHFFEGAKGQEQHRKHIYEGAKGHEQHKKQFYEGPKEQHNT